MVRCVTGGVERVCCERVSEDVSEDVLEDVSYPHLGDFQGLLFVHMSYDFLDRRRLDEGVQGSHQCLEFFIEQRNGWIDGMDG